MSVHRCRLLITVTVKVHRVDNVPVGLAMPLSLTTRIGHAMVVSYEMIFTQPDSVTYSKTGMLFGANLIVKSTDLLSRNPEIINLFQTTSRTACWVIFT